MAKGRNAFQRAFEPNTDWEPWAPPNITPADLGWHGAWWESGTGPIPSRYAEDFKWYVEIKLDKNLKVYRGWGGNAGANGNADGTWYSLLPTSPGSFIDGYRDQFRLYPDWDALTHVDERTIPAGTTIYMGPAAGDENYGGGGIQVWVPK